MDGGTAGVLVSVALGVGLAAACGFRIFLPPLVLSLAAMSGHVQLTESLAWIGSSPALVAFAVATLVEIGAYYVPWLDNALDWLGAPVAVVAGTLITASVLTGMDPLLRWTLAAIAGGGAAGAVHGSMAVLRKLSSFTTGGVANPVVSTAEAGGSLLLSVLAVLAPVLAVVGLGALALAATRLIRRGRMRRAAAAGA